jgi:hypothetical protein
MSRSRAVRPKTMYTHCRQFPHLQGLPDAEIRQRVSKALVERPHLLRVMRYRNRLQIVAMALGAYLLYDPQRSNLGFTLMLIGGIAFIFILLWNVVWLNRILFRITQP